MLRIQLLGAVRLRVDDQPVIRLRGNRSRSVLTKLLLCSNQPVPRSVLSSLLWPDSSESQARTNLRRELHTLRQTHIAIDASLLISRDSLQWRMSSDCECDVELFLAQCDAFKCSESKRDQMLCGGYGLDFYGGDLAQGLNDEWIHAERQHLKEKWLTLLENYIPLLVGEKRIEKAVSLLELLVTHCPYKESAYLQLMQVHLLAGNSALAQHAYNRCAKILQKDLNVLPSTELQELHQRLSRKINVNAPRARHINTDIANLAETKLVGRDCQIKEITQEINCVSHKGGVHLIMISGNAGMGKTRLIEELLRTQGRSLKETPTAYCNEAQGERPLHAAISWINSDSVRINLESLSALHQKILLQNFPEIFLELDCSGPKSSSEKRSGSSKVPAEHAVTLLHAAMTELLVGEANDDLHKKLEDSTTQLIFIDDIQWCDQDSLEWLNQLVVTKLDKPLVVLATRRIEETPPGHPVETLRLNLQGKGKLTDYILEPLAKDSSMQVIRDESIRLGGTDVDVDVDAVEICRRAEGNPLFLIEMTRFKVANGALSAQTGESDIYPPRIHAVIQERINRMSPDAQTLVTIASVIGRSFSVELIQTVCEFPDDKLISLMDDLWHAGLIMERDKTGYDFSHDCIREAGYLALSSPRRRTLHDSVATALEQIHFFDARSVSAQIALHWEESGDSKKAVEWFIKAMTYSCDLLAMRDVIRYGTAALKHLDGMESTEQVVEQRVNTLFKLAYARSVTDGFGSSSVHKICLELEESRQHIDDPSILYMIAGRIRMYCSFAGQLVEALKYTFHQIKVARDLDDSVLIIDSYRSKAFVEFQLARHRASSETARMACDVGAACEESGEFDASKPLWSLLMSHAIQAHGLCITGKGNLGREVFAKCHSFESCVGDNHLKGLVLLWMGIYYHSSDNVAEARRVSVRMIAIGEEYGIGRFTAFGGFFGGWASLRTENIDSAVEKLRTALALYKTLDEHIFFPMIAVTLAQAHLRDGNLIDAEQACTDALQYANKYKMPAWNSEIYRVQAKIASSVEGKNQAVLSLYRNARKVAVKQGATIYLLRTLADEYEFLIRRELDSSSVRSDLMKIYRKCIGYGWSSELERIEKILRLPCPLMSNNPASQVPLLSAVQRR